MILTYCGVYDNACNIYISCTPCIALLEKGITIEKILTDYPDLEVEDIKACIAYAKHLVANETIEEINIGQKKITALLSP